MAASPKRKPLPARIRSLILSLKRRAINRVVGAAIAAWMRTAAIKTIERWDIGQASGLVPALPGGSVDRSSRVLAARRTGHHMTAEVP